MTEKLSLPELPDSHMFIEFDNPMTMEWQEFLRSLLKRVGGVSGPSTIDSLMSIVTKMFDIPINYNKRIDELEKKLLIVPESENYNKRISELEKKLLIVPSFPKDYIKRIDELERQLLIVPSFPKDYIKRIDELERQLLTFFKPTNLVKELSALEHTMFANPSDSTKFLVNRHIRVSAASWKPGVTAPTVSRLSVFPTLIFTVGDDAHYSLICPFRMKINSTVNVVVDFTHRDAIDVGTAEWTLEYNNVAVDESVTGATTTISGISGPTAQHDLTRVELTTSIIGAVAHDDIGMILSHTNGGTIGVNVDLIQVHFEFVMDKLGQPT